jgi:hypothetical protein
VNDEPRTASLPIRHTIAGVVDFYRRHWRVLIPLSLVALLPQAIGDAAIGDLEIDGFHPLADATKVLTGLLTVAINLGGEALYSGIIAAFALHWRAGISRPDLREVARRIPYLTLIAADVVIAVGTALGLALLVVPGIMFITYTFIAPPLIEVRDLGLRAALRESVHLVRGNFWRVLALVVIFYGGTELVTSLVMLPFHDFESEAVAHLAIEAVLEPFQGAAAVIIALALLEIHGVEPVAPGTERPARRE